MATGRAYCLIATMLTALFGLPSLAPAARAAAPQAGTSTLTLVGQVASGSYSKVRVDGARLYAKGSVSIEGFDLATPATPILRVSSFFGQPNDFAIADGLAYVVTQSGVLFICDTQGPGYLATRASYSITATLGITDSLSIVPTSVQARGNALYIATSETITSLPPYRSTLVTLDTTDLFSLTRRSSQSLGPASVALALTEDSLLVGGNIDTGGATLRPRNPYLRQLSLSDPLSPTTRASYASFDFFTPATAPLAVAGTGNTAYLGALDGLRVIDLSSPLAPALATTLPITPTDIKIVGERAYLALGDQGVQVLGLSNPLSPTLIASYDTPGTAQGIDVAGDLVYVADGAGGLLVLQLSERAAAAIPPAGGTLTSPDGKIRASFAAGTFSATTTISYSALSAQQTPASGRLARVGPAFELAGTAPTSATLGQPYTLTVHYSSGGVTQPATLGLYRWDGTQWQRETSSVVDTAGKTVQAQPRQLGIWALLGETRRALLPLVLH